MRFRGRFEYTIDSKGRLNIPSRFREVLLEEYGDEILVLTNFDHCLFAYPLSEWEVIEEKLGELPVIDEAVTSFKRFFYSSAQECSIDKQGRILIPPALRKYAGLDKEVILAGMIRYFELWDSKRFWEVTEMNLEKLKSIKEVLLTKVGI